MDVSTIKENRVIILFQAYGTEYCQQATYSIFSLLRQHNWDPYFQIVVLTDDRSQFAELEQHRWVHIIIPTSDLLREWDRYPKFFLRRKISGFQHIQQLFRSAVIEIDVDTVFYSKIDKLVNMVSAQDLVLHKKEYRMSYSRKSRPSLLPGDRVYTTPSQKQFTVNNDTYMWNSGLIGLAWERAAVMNDVLSVADQIFEDCNDTLSEQLAFSVVFGTHGPLKEPGEDIWHYWRFKGLMSDYLVSKWPVDLGFEQQKLVVAKHSPRLHVYTRRYVNGVKRRLGIFFKKRNPGAGSF